MSNTMNSMIGALIGDAAGATLEFSRKEITEDVALNAMSMPGGGALGVGRGQITDDGELTLTLWRSLNSLHSSHFVPILTIIKGYRDWYDSMPFDIGGTCSGAFETYSDFFTGKNVYTVEDCKETVKKMNFYSEANGALMRATAIATWSVVNNIDILMGIECAKEDARLSHPNIICQECNAIYVFAIINLLRGASPQEVIELTNDFVDDDITSDKVKYWYFEESKNIKDMNCKIQIGHVRWGFVLAFYFLRNSQYSYEDAIKITLMKGGDTDTNAAIVGGMVGAYNTIPDYMKTPVLEFDCTASTASTASIASTRKHHIRPAEYCVKHVIGKLLE
jgi:ADP-ribosyl-[dinitrogen reductase] hydrolase